MVSKGGVRLTISRNCPKHKQIYAKIQFDFFKSVSVTAQADASPHGRKHFFHSIAIVFIPQEIKRKEIRQDSKFACVFKRSVLHFTALDSILFRR